MTNWFNDQLKSIGLDDKKLQNWPTSASSYNNENFGEKEDSNSMNNEKGIVHELQSNDTVEDDELSNFLKGTGGQSDTSRSEQQPVAPTVLGKLVRPVGSTGQTGCSNRSDRFWSGTPKNTKIEAS